MILVVEGIRGCYTPELSVNDSHVLGIDLAVPGHSGGIRRRHARLRKTGHQLQAGQVDDGITAMRSDRAGRGPKSVAAIPGPKRGRRDTDSARRCCNRESWEVLTLGWGGGHRLIVSASEGGRHSKCGLDTPKSTYF